MAAAVSIKKKSKAAKSKKRGWKKADVEDVDDFLEDKRLNERIGGPASEKQDSELFFVDKAVEEETGPGSKRSKREPKALKCHALLLPDPSIKPARIKHNVQKDINRVKQHCPAVRGRIEKGLSTGKEKLARFHRWKAVKARRRRIHESRSLKTGTRDLWDDEDITAKPEGVDEHYWDTTKQRRVKVPQTLRQKPSALPPVELAHPGASYNPSYEDHQDLIIEAAIVENEKERKEKKIRRALDSKFPTRENAPTAATWIKEMSAGILNDDESGEEGEAGDLNRLSVNPPVRRENKKTERQRRKAKQQEIMEKKAKRKKEARARNNELNRIKSLKKEVNKLSETQKEKAQAKSSLRKEQSKTRTKRLGKAVFEDADMPVKLSAELEGSLRQLKPEGDLLVERFKSLQKRNMIEARGKPEMKKKRVQKRRQRKVYENRAHRGITL